MKLAAVYANSCGVKLPEEPVIPYRAYFPILGEYITIHNGSGMESKNYDYYSEVLEILIKRLAGVRFVQIGVSSEKLLPYCLDLRGQTNLYQCNYIIENALVHIGNDSVWVHNAGALNTPSVSLYGPTLANVCAPFYHHPKSKFLESHRNGNRPTHSVEENPKTINLINPEEVANAVLEILGLPKSRLKTLYMGKNYKNPIIDVVPDHFIPENLFVHNSVNARLDIGGEEGFVPSIIGPRIGNLVTNKPVSDAMISFLRSKKGASLLYKVDDENINMEFITKLSQSSIPYSVVTENSEILTDLKFKLLNFEPPRKIVGGERPEVDTKNALFKSSKILAAGENFYLSEWHFRANLPLSNLAENIGEVPDTNEESFWKDVNNYFIFKP